MSAAAIPNGHVNISLPSSPVTYTEKSDLVKEIAWRVLFGLSVVGLGVSFVAAPYIPVAIAVIAFKASVLALGILIFVKLFDQMRPYLPEGIKNAIELIKATLVELAVVPYLGLTFLMTTHYSDGEKLKKLENNQTKSEHPPVLLVHGFLHNSTAWSGIKGSLEKEEGIGPVYTVDLGNPFLSIEEYKNRVHARVEEIKKAHGRDDVILVGHSMGGLVSAKYAIHHNPNVKKIITLGTPAKGTPMAYLARVLSFDQSACAREMSPGSSLVQELPVKLKEHSIKVVNFCSGADVVVPGSDRAAFDTNEKVKVVFGEMGHLRYLFSGRVLDTLISELKSGSGPALASA